MPRRSSFRRPSRPTPDPRTLHRALWACLLVLAACLPAAAQGDAWQATLVVPAADVTVTDDAVHLRVRGAETSYVEGLGWLSGWGFPAPVVREDGRVLIAPSVADALGVPHLGGVRTGADGATTRIVLDVPRATAGALVGARANGVLAPGEGRTIPLPGVLLPEGILLDAEGVVVRGLPADGDAPARIRVEAPEARFELFPLANPARVVLDLAPIGLATEPEAPEAPVPGPALPSIAPESLEPEVSDVAPGVVYRRTTAPGSEGPSVVHVVELDPLMTDLRVVGTSGEGRSVPDWASGGVAAINAGYFDPADFRAIGLRRIGGTLLSLPSRGRAAVGFGPTGTIVARADARVRIRIDGRLAVDAVVNGDTDLELSRAEGTSVGSPRQGVLTLTGDGSVASNGIGPARVPAGGAAIAYDPTVRPLALLDPGRRATVAVTLEPAALDDSAWAVEAGPLLVEDGRAAFAPEREGFARGQRILDQATQQSALGVRADGTVLFVVAEKMVAEDLVALFLDLDAVAALRMDSGSSATLVAGGRTVNRLLTRRVESAIVAVPNVDAGVAR